MSTPRDTTTDKEISSGKENLLDFVKFYGEKFQKDDPGLFFNGLRKHLVEDTNLSDSEIHLVLDVIHQWSVEQGYFVK